MDRYFFYVKSTAGAEAAGNSGDYETKVLTDTNPWDDAHNFVKSRSDLYYAEPDLDNNNPEANAKQNEEGMVETAVAEDQYDPDWPFPTVDGQPAEPNRMIWHIDKAYSQLRNAWQEAGEKPVIRIAHFDTGYDPDHSTFPKDNIDFDLQRNFVEPEIDSAADTGSEGWFKNPGHGTGTLSILAGNLVDLPVYGNYHDYIGIHDHIRIVPIRIAKSVVLWKNKAFTDALDYVINLNENPDTRVHVITMSMGGLPSRAWADAVNRAYEKGIFIATAAGNNFDRLTPTTLVYPARFGRVTAACGVTFDRSPYFKDVSLGALNRMQGNFGPLKVMGKAIAAFTPNVAWAVYQSKNIVSINGAGTSSATPQIAAAAALYYQRHHDQLEQMEGWQRIEAIRRAMYSTAGQNIAEGYNNNVKLYFGNGILQAADMLSVAPSTEGLVKEPAAVVRFPFLKLITGTSLLESALTEGSLTDQHKDEALFETEIVQLISTSAELQTILHQEERSYSDLGPAEQKSFWTIIMQTDHASKALKEFITDYQLAN